MIRLSLTKERQFDLTLERRSDRRNARLGHYRFARSSKQPGRHIRRAFNGSKALFRATLKLIAAARLHRIERELRIGGPCHDWLRIDDDHFTPI